MLNTFSVMAVLMMMSITSILISQDIAVIGSYNPTTGEITTTKSNALLNNAFSKLEGKKVTSVKYKK